MTAIQTTNYLYTVQPRDTLYSIASRLGSTVPAIEQANSLYPPFTDPGLIFPGQLLIVPGGRYGYRYEVYYIVSPGDTLLSISQQFSGEFDLLLGINSQIANPNLIYLNQPILVPAFIYEIQSGDSLYRIASQTGIRIEDIIKANDRRASFSPDVLYPGYRLILPLASSRNILVNRPLPGDTIQSGSLIEGVARVFEANVLYSIVDNAGNVISPENFITARAAGPEYGYFSTNVEFNREPTTSTGDLRVYTRSANDGSVQDLVRVKIGFT